MIARQKPQTPITVSTTVGEDHRLIIDIPLPPDAPSGEVQVEVVIRPLIQNEPVNSALEIAREKMRTVGHLSTAWQQYDSGAVLDDEVLWELVKLAPNSVSSEQLIDEDRGEY